LAQLGGLISTRLFPKLSMAALELIVLAGCSLRVRVDLSSLPWNLVLFSLSPLQSVTTTLVVSPQRTSFIYVNAASMLPFVSASFSKSSKTKSSVQNSAVLQCRYPTLGPKFCLDYFSNPLQINSLAIGMLAANDSHPALLTPVRLLKY